MNVAVTELKTCVNGLISVKRNCCFWGPARGLCSLHSMRPGFHSWFLILICADENTLCFNITFCNLQGFFFCCHIKRTWTNLRLCNKRQRISRPIFTFFILCLFCAFILVVLRRKITAVWPPEILHKAAILSVGFQCRMKKRNSTCYPFWEEK